MSTTAAATRTAATARYAEKKKAIVAAASDILNHHGVKGMTLAGVASRVGLITTSVTYYFKKKEDLAVACFLDGIARFGALATDELRVDGPHAFAKIREIFVAPELAWLDAQAQTPRAQILTEQIFWAVAWLPRYDLEDYDRIRERMYDIFVNGLSVPGRSARKST